MFENESVGRPRNLADRHVYGLGTEPRSFQSQIVQGLPVELDFQTLQVPRLEVGKHVADYADLTTVLADDFHSHQTHSLRLVHFQFLIS